jgi:hypothetical protein
MKEFSSYKILIKPNFLRFFGVIYHSVQAIYPFIIAPKYVTEKASTRDPNYLSIFEHEVVHLRRAKELGVLRWYLSYLLSPKFRLNEEVVAYKKKFEVLKKYGRKFDIDSHARALSGWVYGKMIGYEDAKKLLTFK